MTHPHEYIFDIYEKHEKTVCRFVCRHDYCDEVLEGPEVLKRLNATDELLDLFGVAGVTDIDQVVELVELHKATVIASAQGD